MCMGGGASQDASQYIATNTAQAQAYQQSYNARPTVESMAGAAYFTGRAADAQKIVDQQTAAQQAAAAQAQERQQIIAAQQAEQQALARQAQQAQQQQAQQLAAQQAAAAEQQARIATTGAAVSQSLRILGSADASEAPAPVMSGGRRARAKPRSTTASLRFGSTSQGAGTGANLAT